MVALSPGAAPIQADWNVWNTIGAWLYPPSYCFGWTTRVDYAVVVVDLLVDTDRDNAVDAADEAGKADWTPSRGAIILLNSDIDNTTTGAPDDWAGGPYAGQGDCPANNVIDGNGDVYDIGPLCISKLGMSTLPDDFVLQLWVEKPPSEDSWFGQFSAEQRVRIFLPSNGASFAEGDQGIIGPDVSDHVDFVKNPGDGQYNDSIFAGSGQIRFGIEGLIPGAMVDIKIRVTFGNFERTDTVRVKVSPFILLNNTDMVTGNGKTVFVSNYVQMPSPPDCPDQVNNGALREVLSDYYGEDLDATGPAADVWLQDGCEIGYVQAPYGKMPMVLELPRSTLNGSALKRFIETNIVAAGVGIFVLEGDASNLQDYGGDIECLPDPSGNSEGFFFHGNGAGAFLTNFFVAQGNLNPSLGVNTGWLAVKHVQRSGLVGLGRLPHCRGRP